MIKIVFLLIVLAAVALTVSAQNTKPVKGSGKTSKYDLLVPVTAEEPSFQDVREANPVPKVNFESSSYSAAPGSSAVNGIKSIYPVPAVTEVNIVFSTKKEYDIQIEFYNLIGEKLSVRSFDRHAAGTWNYILNLDTFTSGIYVVKLILGGSVADVKKFNVLK